MLYYKEQSFRDYSSREKKSNFSNVKKQSNLPQLELKQFSFYFISIYNTMGKVTHKRNPDTSTVETSANASENAGIVISAFDNSTTADHFALITHAVDRHRLRIFNVRSGTVSNDYSAQEKERITCLTWGYMKDSGDLQVRLLDNIYIKYIYVYNMSYPKQLNRPILSNPLKKRRVVSRLCLELLL